MIQKLYRTKLVHDLQMGRNWGWSTDFFLWLWCRFTSVLWHMQVASTDVKSVKSHAWFWADWIFEYYVYTGVTQLLTVSSIQSLKLARLGPITGYWVLHHGVLGKAESLPSLPIDLDSTEPPDGFSPGISDTTSFIQKLIRMNIQIKFNIPRWT